MQEDQSEQTKIEDVEFNTANGIYTIKNVPIVYHRQFGKLYDGSVALKVAQIYDHMKAMSIYLIDYDQWPQTSGV
jgi:hypothetical protein